MWEKAILAVLIVAPVFALINMYNFVFPNKTPEYIIQHQKKYKEMGMLHWEDGKDHEIPQYFADMLGWSELAQKVDKVYAEINEPDNTLVLCDNYRQAGAINFYTTQKIRAVAFNADYFNWFDLSKKYTNIVRIEEHKNRGKELNKIDTFFKTAFITQYFITNNLSSIFNYLFISSL